MGALTSGSATPAVAATRSRDLVNVGYPNNDSFFYLLHDVDGKAEAQCVGEARGVVTANWIDPPAAGVSNVWDAKRRRGRLTGGRWSNDPNYPVYRLTSVSAKMRGAFLEHLVRVEGGKRLQDSPGGSASVAIGNATFFR